MRYSTFALALSALLPVAASATTYNVVTDFSTTNPSGQFYYGIGDPTTGGAPLTYQGTGLTLGGTTYPFSYFAASANSLPAVGHGDSEVKTGTVDVPSSQLFLHPGSAAGQDALVAFMAPTAGTYNVDVTFTHDDTANSGTGQTVGVYADDLGLGTSSLLGSVTLGTVYGDAYTFDQSVSLAAGEFLVFDVALTGGNYSYDSTGLSGTITSATPEPSSLVLLGSGILGLAGAVRRRLRG